MSWLFGRRNEDDEEEEEDDHDDEDVDEGEDYSSEEEEGGGGEDGGEEEENPAATTEPVPDEKCKSEPEPLQNVVEPMAIDDPLPVDQKAPDDDSTEKLPEAIEISAETDIQSEGKRTTHSTEANPGNHGDQGKDNEATSKEEKFDPVEEEIPNQPPQPKIDSTKEDYPTEVPVAGEDKDAVSVSDAAAEKEGLLAKPDDAQSNPVDLEEDKKEDGDGQQEEVEEVTSTHEKRSLLVLAAEHDRVDILRAILADDSEDRDILLNSSIPPLHISIAYGSTNAVQCLLRMGADPSVRPNIQKIKDDSDAGGEQQLVDIPNMGRFDNLSAWELAFGKSDHVATKKKAGGWFGGSDKKSNSIDIAPSKLEGIRHAFTAEGLRCIGSDEVDRLKQLIDSGMPPTIDIGGKSLYDWAVEMGALQCEELLRPAQADRNSLQEDNSGESQKQGEEQQAAGYSAVRDRSKPGTETLSQLTNRIDELESLSKALSICLDNLAEEVSVCHGLLMMGGGASALASHVRSLKALKQNKNDELDRLEEAWENSEDELAYWVKECGEQGKEIAELMSPSLISSIENEQPPPFEGTPEEELAHGQQLKAQAALLENKIRKLRASIADLSEENTRDLEEVNRRGLSGGINLVRGLRDEIREVEFTLMETKSAEALCRAKIKLIQSKMGQGKKQSNATPKPGTTNGETIPGEQAQQNVLPDEAESEAVKAASQTALVPNQPGGITGVEAEQEASPAPAPLDERKQKLSDVIASGQSSAIAIKKKGRHGYFTVDLWKILLRIIGLGSISRPMATPQSSASNVMIV